MKYQFNLKSVLNLTNFQEAKNTVGQDRHFLAMAMLKQAWHCSFGLPKMFKIFRSGKVVLKGGSKGAFLASKKGGVVQMLCKFVLRKSQVPDYQALDYPKKSGRQDFGRLAHQISLQFTKIAQTQLNNFVVVFQYRPNRTNPGCSFGV